MMGANTAPSATDAVLLTLVDLLSSPDKMKQAVINYQKAKQDAEGVIVEAQKRSEAAAAREQELAAAIADFEAKVAAHENAAADLRVREAAHKAAEEDLKARMRAWESEVKQANTDASLRDSQLGRREFAIANRENAAEAKTRAAEEAFKKYSDAHERLRHAVGV